MSHSASEPSVSRRTVLRGIGTVAAVGAGATVPASAQSNDPDYGNWFENTSNFDGTVDKTGAENVTVTVGTDANGGAFGFGPAAVHVDPGTTVTWEWSGDGGSHNVVAEDGSFESELVAEGGHTFEHTFDSAGSYRYACTPHKAMGMKGAIVVGDASDTSTSTTATATTDSAQSTASAPEYDGWFENTSNFDGTVDKTGTESVTVTVGADANGGAFGFGPAAIRVTPGTTVTWEWSGGGGSHNVVAEDGSFESELVGEEGHTFEHTFDSAGSYRYACTPHKAMGMKGVVVVVAGSDGGSSSTTDQRMDRTDLFTLGGGVGLVGVLLGALGLATREMSLD